MGSTILKRRIRALCAVTDVGEQFEDDTHQEHRRIKMFISNMKANLMRWCQLSWPQRVEMKSWAKRSKSFSSFEVENFNNPLLKVASATNATGETVVYCPVQTCFLVNAFVVSPSASEEQAALAGDLIDQQLSMEAQRAGVSSLLIMVPDDHPALRDKENFGDFKTVRVYQRNFPNTVGTGGIRLSSPSQQATKHFIN